MTRVDMTEGKPLKMLIIFTIPALISNFLSQVYSVTDSIIVGRIIGKQALAAVGVCLPIVMLIVSIVIGINIGCGVLFSQAYGKRNYDRMRHLIVNSFYFAVFISFFIGIAGFFLARPILGLLDTPDEVMKPATAYLQINFLTTFFPLMYYLLYNVFRAMGDSLSALLCLIVSAIFNVFLDILFVAGFNMGVAGSAIATAIAQGAAVVFAIFIYMFKYKELRLKKSDLGLDFVLLGSVIRLALPFALQFAINNLGNILVQRCINSFGDTTMASYTICSRIGSFALIPVENIGASLAVYVGQNYGAKKEYRIEEGVKACYLMNLVVSVVVGLFVVIAGKWLISLFLKEPDQEVVRIAYQYLLIAAAPCILSGFMNIYQNVLKGLGRARDTIICGAIQLVSKVGVALIGSYVLFNITIVWVGWPVSFTLGMIYPMIMYILYKKKLNRAIEVRE